MDMRPKTLRELIERHYELQQALTLADANRVKSRLSAYTIDNLAPDVRKVWNKLQGMSKMEEIDAVFRPHKSVKLRQQLFCAAFLHSGFDLSKACATVGIGRQVLNKWRDDVDFLGLLEEMMFHKKNFIENKLFALCHDMHPGAIMFANRTLNADRGFNEKITVTDNTTVVGQHADFDLSDLDLPPEILEAVAVAIEKYKKAHPVDLENDDGSDEDTSQRNQALRMMK
jgi:hypothetical protein